MWYVVVKSREKQRAGPLLQHTRGSRQTASQAGPWGRWAHDCTAWEGPELSNSCDSHGMFWMVAKDVMTILPPAKLRGKNFKSLVY